MKIFLITILIFLVAILLMAIGVLLGRKPMRSGCAAAREDMNIECAAGCQSPCFKRRLNNAVQFFKKNNR